MVVKSHRDSCIDTNNARIHFIHAPPLQVLRANLRVGNFALNDWPLKSSHLYRHLLFSVLTRETHLLVNNELSDQRVTSEADSNTDNDSKGNQLGRNLSEIA